jgi:hypothetical protein
MLVLPSDFTHVMKHQCVAKTIQIRSQRTETSSIFSPFSVRIHNLYAHQDHILYTIRLKDTKDVVFIFIGRAYKSGFLCKFATLNTLKILCT